MLLLTPCCLLITIMSIAVMVVAVTTATAAATIAVTAIFAVIRSRPTIHSIRVDWHKSTS